MAPTTRRQSARINNLSPTAPATNGHVRFDSSDDERPALGINGVNGHTTEEDELKQIEEQAKAEVEAEAQIQGEEVAEEEAEEEAQEEKEEAEEVESDDEAPEAVSNDGSREAARKREEDVKKAIEQQEEAARQKRKRRDTQLKQQKAESKARKRAKLAHDEAATTEGGVIENFMNVAAAEEVKRPKKAPMLLPEALLEELAARENEPRSRGIDDVTVAKSGAVAKRDNEKEKKIVPRKEKKEFKKGPVSVRVLKDDVKSRKVMAPPAIKSAKSVRNSWLSGHRGVERKSMGGAFSKR